jgi:peptide/nickel transport system substrate-binding protein
VQILNLAYRSGVPWNESGFANAEFDALLDQANGIAGCRCAARGHGAAADDHARRRRDAAALLAVALPSLQATTVVNADMHPKFEINVHYLGVSQPDGIRRPGLGIGPGRF